MTYELCDEELNKFVTKEYLYRIGNNRSNLSEKDVFVKECGNFALKEFFSKDFYISNCDYSINKNVSVQDWVDEEMFFLSFMNKGTSCFSCNSLDKCLLRQNTYNAFYLAGGEFPVSELEKGVKNEITDILISKSYLSGIIEKHPCLFKGLCRKFQGGGSFSLFDSSCFICPKICRIISQLKESELLGNGAELYIESKILELFSYLLGGNNRSKETKISPYIRERVHEAKFIIESNYLAPPGIHELASQVGMSGTALKFYFKKIFNTTIYGYLFEYRMGKARKLLRDNKFMSISEVAIQTGYEYSTHFCTAFKRRFGFTPKDFQKEGGVSY